MSDNRRVFEEVLTQLSGAQDLINQVPFSAEQRRLSDEQVAREESRFQQGREDTVTQQARAIALQNIQQANAALASLDPNNPDDQPLIGRLNAVIQQQQQALTMTGEAALQETATGQVSFPGQTQTTFGAPASLRVNDPRFGPRDLTMTPRANVTPDVTMSAGQALASGAQQARIATERRAEEQREREFSRETFMAQMGFDQENLSREDQQAWQAIQGQADRDLQRGLSTSQIAANLFQQARQLGFQGTQNDLDRALATYQTDTQAGIEQTRISSASSLEARNSYQEDIAKLNPEVPEDQEILEAILVDAQNDPGLLPSHLLQVQASAKAQSGEDARLYFENLEGNIKKLDIENAYNQVQLSTAEYDLLAKKATDERASLRDAATFLEQTVLRGDVGVPTLEAMLGAMQSGNIETSQYYHFLKHLDEGQVEAALGKARELGEDAELRRLQVNAEASRAIMEQRNFSVTTISDMYSPEEIEAYASMSPEEITNPVDRMIHEALQPPGNLARAVQLAEWRENTEEYQQAAPKLAFAQSQISFYSSHRPEDINAGADAVRAAYQTMAEAGLIGDPDDPEGQKAEIEMMVSFFRQAWGDDAEAFDAEMAESLSRTALNNANANRLLAEAEADGGVSLDVLKFQMDLVENGIEATVTKAEQLGCAITAQGIKLGEKAVCDALAYEVAGWQENYNALLITSGFTDMDTINYAQTLADVAADIDRENPGISGPARDAMIENRLRLITTGFQFVQPSPSDPVTPETPRAPMTAEQRGAAFAQGVYSGAGNVGEAISGGAVSAAQFINGMFNPGGVDMTQPELPPATPAPGSTAPVSPGTTGRMMGTSTTVAGGGGGPSGGPFAARVPPPDPDAPFADYAPQAQGLLDALIWQESRGNHTDESGGLTTSSSGALGITQVMPATGRSPGHGVTPLRDQTEEEYLRFGRDYLAALLDYFGGDEQKALAAYNTGAGNVERAVARDPDNWLALLPEETQDYVPSILNRLRGAG